jgi:NADH-quinone oxidoreductase subunit N
MWTPDVYEGAPTPIVGFFAGAPKLAAMVLFARILSEGFSGATAQWSQVLILIAIASVVVGAFAGLAQKNLKRLWAYSSIANVGYALVGLAAGGQDGIQSMLMFMVLYTIDVTGFFACLAALSRDGRPMETMDDFAGLMKERPGLALAITAFSLSALGLPPFSGFWAKFYVFKAALAGGPALTAAAVIALVGSVVAAFYYLRLIKVMWLDPAPGKTDAPAAEPRAVAYVTALFSFPLVLIALIGLDPLAQAAAAALTHH